MTKGKNVQSNPFNLTKFNCFCFFAALIRMMTTILALIRRRIQNQITQEVMISLYQLVHYLLKIYRNPIIGDGVAEVRAVEVVVSRKAHPHRKVDRGVGRGAVHEANQHGRVHAQHRAVQGLTGKSTICNVNL